MEAGAESEKGHAPKPSTPTSSKRGRGRPPGSKNRPKLTPVAEEPLFEEQLHNARSSHRFDKREPARDLLKEGEERAAKKRATKAKEKKAQTIAPKRAVLQKQLKAHVDQLEQQSKMREASHQGGSAAASRP